jgi:hypothetical protein
MNKRVLEIKIFLDLIDALVILVFSIKGVGWNLE